MRVTTLATTSRPRSRGAQGNPFRLSFFHLGIETCENRQYTNPLELICWSLYHMGEIQSGSNNNGIDEDDEANKNKKLVNISLKTIGPSPPSLLQVPSPIRVRSLSLPPLNLLFFWFVNVSLGIMIKTHIADSWYNCFRSKFFCLWWFFMKKNACFWISVFPHFVWRNNV